MTKIWLKKEKQIAQTKKKHNFAIRKSLTKLMMKKLYAMIALVVVGSLSASAQLTRKTAVGKQHQKQVPANLNAARHSSQTNSTNAVIWSDDFSTPANWSIAHEAGTTGDWAIGTTGPSGSFPINTITSASAANGFAIFDSDLICSGNQIGNLSTVNPIDLTGHASVRLTFSQYYCRYYDSTYVFVSTDNTNWTKFEVNGNLVINDFSANNNSAVNPEIVNVDISSVAGNSATVYIRFQFYSPSTIDVNAGCAYAWMLDDVSISDIPAIDAAAYNKAFAGEYSIISLLNTTAFSMNGRIINTGGTAITGGTIAFNVYNASGPVYNDLATLSSTLNPGDTSAVLNAAGSYAPADTGIYIIEQIIGVSGDGDAANDTVLAFVYVDDSTNARDYTALDASGYLGGFGFNAQSGSLGQMYHIYQASQATSATFFLDAPTIGDQISITLHSTAAGMPDAEIGTTGTYTLTAADTAVFVTLPFTSPVNVTSGDYFLALNQLGVNNITLGASADIYTPGKIMFDGGSGWTDVGGVGNLSFILRLNNPSSTLVSVPKINQNDLYSVYPNPSNGLVYIKSTSTQGKVFVNILNTLGKVVKSATYNSFSNETIDLSTLATGTYTVQIISENGVANKSIVLSTK